MCLCLPGTKPHSDHEVKHTVKDDKTITCCCIPHRVSLPILLTIQLFATVILLIKSDLANFQLVDSDFLPDGNLRDYTVLAPYNTKNLEFEEEEKNLGNFTDSNVILDSGITESGFTHSGNTNPTPVNIRINREILPEKSENLENSEIEEYEDLTVSNDEFRDFRDFRDFRLIEFLPNATETPTHSENSETFAENSTKSFHQITFRDYAEKSHKIYGAFKNLKTGQKTPKTCGPGDKF